MQIMIKASIAVRPSALGILLVMLLNMLTRQRKTVTLTKVIKGTAGATQTPTRIVILPGTLSGGTRKLIQDTMTNRPRKERLSKGPKF